jgi:hypothetical protein
MRCWYSAKSSSMKKNLLTTIATLRDVMRKTGDYDACDSRHKVYRHHEDEINILSPELP